MGSVKETATKITLDQIEQEITQIDQIIHSWSDGRMLRFDPSHAQPVVETPTKNLKDQVEAFQAAFRVGFLVNLVGVGFGVALIAAQVMFSLVSTTIFTVILSATVILGALFNLLQAVYASQRAAKFLVSGSLSKKKYPQQDSPRSRV
ncbi:MAG: hypothetical protein VX438_13310 [Planctomycetota bacterium]|nr:hypothetical protein [Planctomycetota bacterium]